MAEGGANNEEQDLNIQALMTTSDLSELSEMFDSLGLINLRDLMSPCTGAIPQPKPEMELIMVNRMLGQRYDLSNRNQEGLIKVKIKHYQGPVWIRMQTVDITNHKAHPLPLIGDFCENEIYFKKFEINPFDSAGALCVCNATFRIPMEQNSENVLQKKHQAYKDNMFGIFLDEMKSDDYWTCNKSLKDCTNFRLLVEAFCETEPGKYGYLHKVSDILGTAEFEKDFEVHRVIPDTVPVDGIGFQSSQHPLAIILTADSYVPKMVKVIFTDQEGWKETASHIRIIKNVIECNVPAYKDRNITQPKKVSVIVEDMQKKKSTEPIDMEYIVSMADTDTTERKRKKPTPIYGVPDLLQSSIRPHTTPSTSTQSATNTASQDTGFFIEDEKDQLVHFLIQNFSLIVEEVHPESLMVQLCKEYPKMNKLFSLTKSVKFRKPLCVRLLLEILVHYEECIPTLWDIIGKMYGHLKAEFKTRDKQSPHFITPGEHTCHKCSTPAFLEFLTQFQNIPQNLLIELLQTERLQPVDFLEIIKCDSDEDKLKLFKRFIESHAISYLDFVAALLSVAEKKDQVITMMVCHLDDQLCDEFKTTYNLSEMSLTKRDGASQLSIRNPKKKVEPHCARFIAVVKLRSSKGVEFEKKLVETISRRKEKINSKIKKYGKIEAAWLGSVVVVLKITSKSGKDIFFPHIYQSLKKMTEHLQEEGLDLRVIDLDDAGMTDKEKDLHRKKLTIMLNLEVFKTDLAIEIFRKEFSKRNIMNEAEFKTKFKVGTCGRQQRTEIFLNFILQSQVDVMEAFMDVLKTNEDHELLSEKFNNALEYQNPVQNPVCEEYTSNESERTGTSACAMEEKGNAANIQTLNTCSVIDRNLLTKVRDSSSNTCTAAASVGTQFPIRIEKIENATIYQIYSSNETENNFNTVNEINSKVSMHGEGNTSIVNFSNTENEDEGNDTNEDDEDNQ